MQNKAFPPGLDVNIFHTGMITVSELLVIYSEMENYHHVNKSKPNMEFPLSIFMAIFSLIDSMDFLNLKQ